jgi:hypothetical protein
MGRRLTPEAAPVRAVPAAPPRRGTPFVARRAVDPHGCALPHSAPLLRRLRRLPGAPDDAGYFSALTAASIRSIPLTMFVIEVA